METSGASLCNAPQYFDCGCKQEGYERSHFVFSPNMTHSVENHDKMRQQKGRLAETSAESGGKEGCKSLELQQLNALFARTLVINGIGEVRANICPIGSLRTEIEKEFNTGLTNREEDKTKMRKQKGFSLIELLIVVAIILIIAAIAIPNLLRAKISANESSAVGSVRNIITAETSYSASYNEYGFALTLDLLGNGTGLLTCPAAGPDPTKGACLLDSALAGSANSSKSGYNFEAVADPASKQPADVNGISAYTSFTITAVPATYNQSGVRAFCAGEDGVLRQNPNTGGTSQGLAKDFTPWATNCTVKPWSILQ